MAVINYTAKRNVTGGRTIGNSYNLTLNFVRFTRKPKRHVNTAKSLSGREFTTLHRLDQFYDAQTAPESDSSTLDQTREFLDSVAGGEVFQIDSADYKIDGDPQESLVEISGYYSFSFRVIAQ